MASVCGVSNSPGAVPLLAPGLDELAVLGELHDPRIGVAAVSVGDEDVAIGRDQDVGGCVEDRGCVVAGDAGLAQGHQHLAVRAELDDRVALAVLGLEVGHPDIAVAVGVQAVRGGEHAGAEIRQHLAGLRRI